MSVREKKSLEEAVELMLGDHRYTRATRSNYAITLRPMAVQLGAIRPLEEITYSDLLNYTNRAFAQTSSSSRWQYTQRIRAFFRYAVMVRWVEYSPADALFFPRPPKDPTKSRAIPTPLLDALLDYTYRACERDYTILVLLCRTGMRRSACANIQISHISREKHQIGIWDKGGFTWAKPLTAEVEHVVWHYIENSRPKQHCPHDYLFTTLRRESGVYQPLHPFTLSNRIHKLCLKIGAEKGYRAHAIRHWVAEMLDEDGVDEGSIQAILNQRSRASTKNYLSTKSTQVEQAAQHLSDLHQLPSGAQKSGKPLPKIIRFNDIA